MRRGAALIALGLLVGCSGGDGGATSAPPSPAAPAPSAERVRATLDGVELLLEVADDEQERAVGLMRRTSVPPGTGMVFVYDELVEHRFYMFDVPIPLKAVFLRDGKVVSVVVMPPCEQGLSPQQCPTYGADGPYDTVVETDPDTLPDVAPGDRFELAA